MPNQNPYPNDAYEYVDIPAQSQMPYPAIPPYGMQEQDVTNIVAQIDPKTIIDNLDHALKGEHYDKDKGMWVMNASKKPIVNDACRGSIISYLDGILTNNTTMGNIDEKRLSFLMESVIESITKKFTTNLEQFGFVNPTPKKNLAIRNGMYYIINDFEPDKINDVEFVSFKGGMYENKGNPDSATMTLVSNMVYKVCFLVFTRALKGQESIRIFKSLSMVDQMGYGYGQQQHDKKGWIKRMFGM